MEEKRIKLVRFVKEEDETLFRKFQIFLVVYKL